MSLSDARAPHATWDRAIGLAVLLFLLVYSYNPVSLPFAGSWRLSWKVALAAPLVLLLLRHVLYPRPWLGAICWAALRRHFWDDGASFVLKVGLASRVAVVLIGLAVAVGVAPRKGMPRVSDEPAWSFASKWDALFYLEIALGGYAWDRARDSEPWNVAFFPAFPIAQRVAGSVVTMPLYVIGDNTWLGGGSMSRLQLGGVLLSIATFLWGLSIVFKLARQDIGDHRAMWAVLLLAYFPFALFFSVPYTEGLFFLAVASAFLAVREGRPIAAFGWGALAALTRQTGVLLALPLAVLVIEPWWRSRAPARPSRLMLAATAGPLVGLALHMGYLWMRFDDPWAWVAAQKGWWHSESWFSFVYERYLALKTYGLTGYFHGWPGAAVGTFVPLFALALIGRVWRLSPAYAALVGVTLLPAIAIDTPSIGRLASPLFPLFIALAQALPASRHSVLVAVIFGAAQLWAASRFFLWEKLY